MVAPGSERPTMTHPLKSTTLAILMAASLALAACTTTSPDVVSRSEAQRLSTVVDAVVLSSRPVVVEGQQSGLGAAAGSVAGGVAGSGVGGRREAVVVGVLGAVIGGVIGNAVERGTTREDAIEILVQLKNGDRRSVVQAKASETFNPGDSVLLINTAGKVRVARAPATSAPAATTPRM